MGSNSVEASEFFLGFLCNCLSCFTTVKISFTCQIACLQSKEMFLSLCTYMVHPSHYLFKFSCSPHKSTATALKSATHTLCFFSQILFVYRPVLGLLSLIFRFIFQMSVILHAFNLQLWGMAQLLMKCVYDMDHMHALQIENTSESDPHSYEVTKAVAKKAQWDSWVQSIEASEFFLGFLHNFFQ